MPADRDDAVIRLSQVSVSFGAVAALRGIDLTIRRGEAIALLGPSGCGKTTLLRAITGAAPVAGERRLTGDIGIVYQDLKLLSWLTVGDNILLARPACHNAARDMTALLDRVGMSGKLHAYPYQLSGGQRQRVAIARALFGGADILLLDEPFSALDFLAKDRLIRLIRDLQSNHQLTLVMVTHDLEDAVILANRLVVLRDGMIAGDLGLTGPDAAEREATRAVVLKLYGEQENVGTS